ncbi:MAG TPA: late competence development ComFB family protein [Gemmatimonadales bacterium]|jgi:competence protein ComFB
MKNVVEEFVKNLYDELRPGVPTAHDCRTCEEDVMVYALNRLPAHYVATPKGEVLSRLDIQIGQQKTDATIAIMEAFRFVAANPRCGRSPGN